MCDYSLHNVASREARIGDELVTTNFAISLTHGFAAVGEPAVAVCLKPGTELAFAYEAEYWHPLARLLPRFKFGKIGAKVARFRQINVENPYAHHDALEFANGRIVLVHELCPGQRASVLQLPVKQAAAPQPVRGANAVI